MPAKNTVKIYIEGGYYHLYNRGVEKRSIFQDDDDYKKFQNLLKVYLSTPKRSDLITARYNRKNLNGQVILLAYCLMPNHFHLLVMQNSKNGIADLVHCLNTSYVAYFNKNTIGWVLCSKVDTKLHWWKMILIYCIFQDTYI